MANDIAFKRQILPTKFDPKKVAKRIAGTQGLMKAYEKAGDLDGFIKALEDHIEATREFVHGYKAKFPDKHPGVANGPVSQSEAFLNQYHLNWMTI